MDAETTQRELRNDSGGILRAVEDGARFVVTRNGTPVARLVPLRRRTFVAAHEAVAMVANSTRMSSSTFRR